MSFIDFDSGAYIINPKFWSFPFFDYDVYFRICQYLSFYAPQDLGPFCQEILALNLAEIFASKSYSGHFSCDHCDIKDLDRKI